MTGLPTSSSRKGTLVTESANVNGMRVVEHLTQKYAREIASCHEIQPDLYATHRLHEDTKLPAPDVTLTQKRPVEIAEMQSTARPPKHTQSGRIPTCRAVNPDRRG